MENKIISLLVNEFPDIDWTSSEELVKDGIIESLVIAKIIVLLSTEFAITIPYEEIVEENFNSVKRIASMVERLSE